MIPEIKTYGVLQVSELLGISRQRVWYNIKFFKIEAIKIPHPCVVGKFEYQVTEESLLRFAKASRRKMDSGGRQGNCIIVSKDGEPVEERVYNAVEAATRINLNVNTVLQYAKNGKIKSSKFSNTLNRGRGFEYVFTETQLLEFLEANKKVSPIVGKRTPFKRRPGLAFKDMEPDDAVAIYKSKREHPEEWIGRTKITRVNGKLITERIQNETDHDPRRINQSNL